METVQLTPLPSSGYTNFKREEVTYGIEVFRSGGFVEVRRVRSDGSVRVKLLMTEAEALELGAALRGAQ
jgi:hypothetical protein